MKKSTLFFTLIFGISLLTTACVPLIGAEPVAPPLNDVKGRYMMFTSPAANGGLPEIYVLDTLSGRIWRKTIFNDVKGIYMVPMPYLSVDQLTASVAPIKNEALDAQSVQKQYFDEVERAKQRKAAAQPPPVAAPTHSLTQP